MSEENKDIKPNNDKSKKVSGEELSIEEVVSGDVSVNKTASKEAVSEEAPVEKVVSGDVSVDKTASKEAVSEEAPVEKVVSGDVPVDQAASEKDSKGDSLVLESLDIPFIIGKKIGMTRLFDDEGNSYPVTLIEAGPCYVTQVKSLDKDGYSAVQIGYLETRESKLNKPKLGHLKGIQDKYLKYLKECRMDDIPDNISVGGEINVNSFEIGDLVNISGSSKGKGFAGHMKRYNFSGGRASHGKNSVMRKAGSVGAGTSPGKVWKGTRMAGRMGNDTVTVQNLQVIKINNEENTIFLNGSIPGSKNSIVYVSKVL